MNLYSIAAPIIGAVKPLESFTVLRRREDVDDYGRSQITTTTTLAVGSITPSGDNTLNRTDDFQTQGNTITVITAFMLHGPSKDADGAKYQPDIVLWNGSNYIVHMLNDYVSSGSGMVVAECTSVDLVDGCADVTPLPPSDEAGQPIGLLLSITYAS
jgi:hypothetical protein